MFISRKDFEEMKEIINEKNKLKQENHELIQENVRISSHYQTQEMGLESLKTQNQKLLHEYKLMKGYKEDWRKLFYEAIQETVEFKEANKNLKEANNELASHVIATDDPEEEYKITLLNKSKEELAKIILNYQYGKQANKYD